MFERILRVFRKSPWYERYFIWLAAGAGVLAFLMALLIGMAQSVWFDEAYSILVAKQPVAEILRLTGVDTHPPLYYLILKGWAGLFGWSDVALRSLSALALGGAVVVGGMLVRRLFGTKAALMTLIFLVLAPFLLRYGFEIRMYALASFIGVLATYLLVCAVEAKDTRRQLWFYAAYAVTVALGIYTLYYLAILWITHVIWLMYLARVKRQSILKQRWWLAYTGSALLFLPWLPTFLGQINNGALAQISQQLTIENIAGIVSFWFLYRPAWQLDGLLSLVIVALLVYLAYAITGAFKAVSKDKKPYLMLLAFYALLPILLVALISLLRPMYVERYLAHTVIAFALLLGVAIYFVSQKKQQWRELPIIALSLVLLFGIGQLTQVGNYNFQRLHKPEVEAVARSIDCNSTILANDPYVAIELGYYLEDCTVQFYSETAKMGGGYAPLSESMLRVADPEKELASAKHITYIYYDEPKLQMPVDFREIEVKSFGPLHIKELQAQ